MDREESEQEKDTACVSERMNLGIFGHHFVSQDDIDVLEPTAGDDGKCSQYQCTTAEKNCCLLTC